MAESHNRYLRFIGQVLEDEPRTPDPEHLDALLHWLAARDTDAARNIQAAFDHHRASNEAAQRLTLNYLDAVLFFHDADPYRLFGLLPDCDFAAIRARHKQLLQVFHPDRHQHHKDWFTRRAERLNHAYAHLKANHGKPPSPKRTGPTVVVTPRPRTRAKEPRTPNPGSRRIFGNKTQLRHRLKEHLGSAATLQQRAFIVLFTVPAVLLLVLYVNNQGSVEGGGISTVAKNDNTPPTSTAGNITAPHNPADLAGTPIPVNQAELITRPAEQEFSGDTAAPEPSSTASRALDGPRRGGDRAPGYGNTASTHESSVTTAEPETTAGPDDTAIAATKTDSRLTNQRDTEPTRDEPRADNTETLPNQPERQPEDEIQTATPDNSSKTARTVTAPTDHTDEAAGHTEKPETADKTEPQPAETQPGPETKTSVAPATTEPDAVESVSADQNDPKPAIRESRVTHHATTDIQAINTLLARYESAYHGSDIDRFSDLFQAEARTKHATGRREIKKKYGEFFQKTSQRRVAFEDVRIQLLGNRQFKVNARFEADWTYPGGPTKSTSGRFRLHLVPDGDNLKIWRLNY